MIRRYLTHWITRRPEVARFAFGMLRKRGQVLQFRNTAIAVGHNAVVEILHNHTDFTIREANRDGFATGPVLLYMDDSSDYKNDVAALNHAFCKQLTSDMERYTDELVAHYLNRPSALFDVVDEFAEPIVASVIARYFYGYEPKCRRELADFRCHLRTLGSALIDGEISPRARHSANEVSALVAARRHQPDAMDLAAKLHRSEQPAICSATGSVAGLSLAAAATVARGLGQIADRLVNDQHLLQTIEQTLGGDEATANSLIDQVVRESLRFSPVLTFIRRYAIRDTQLSQASGGAVLRRGSRILVGLSTAMFDATAFPNPNDFRLDRPAERYLHFGTGLHQCYGQRFAEMFLRKMVTGLVAQKILVGARTESSSFDSWALTNYRISLAGGRACKT